MFSKVLKNLRFDKNSADQATAGRGAYAPNTEIAYNPSLVQELKLKNRTILAGFTLLKNILRKNDVEGSRSILIQLKRLLLDHFIKENISLYVYIKTLAKNNVQISRKLKELKRQMDGVQATIFLFFNTYLDIELTVDKLHALNEELSVLVK